jgi:hypothetical protein
MAAGVALPGSIHDLRAARTQALIDALTRAAVATWSWWTGGVGDHGDVGGDLGEPVAASAMLRLTSLVVAVCSSTAEAMATE